MTKYKTTLLLGFSEASDQPRPIADTPGYFAIGGFTLSGNWLLYWMAEEMSASIESDGLDLYAVNTAAGTQSNSM